MADQKSASGQEIPKDVRDLAETSVAQTRKAVHDYMEAAQRTMGAVESSAMVAQAGAREIGSKMFGFAEANVGAALDFAERLVRAQSPQEFLTIQQEFLRQQMEQINRQMRELGTAATQTISDAAKPKA